MKKFQTLEAHDRIVSNLWNARTALAPLVR